MNRMNVHYFQHVPFEGLGSIELWMKAKPAKISITKFYKDITYPSIREIDWLIIMGGPMSANDEQTYPWLRAEKKFIAEAIADGKNVLGVCLGAQLIACALGAKVYPNRDREIGWFPIESLVQRKNTNLKNIFPSHLEVFHWHGETFDLPAHAVHLARSEGCDNQAFSIGERVLGLQFHLEVTPLTIKSLTEQCQNDLVPGRYVQSAAEMLSVPSRFHRMNSVMDSLLDHWNNFESKP
ncbi:MAG: type 1 glutamine amidotransferase [Ignavibacteriales bacterium]|nr:type 1 glutamine amidotransferase [Ignavibacteriales bacterium]